MKGETRMNKNNRKIGLIYMTIGIIGLAASILVENKLGSTLFGMSFGLMGSAAAMLWKYYYWNRPANTERYKEKLEQENINLHDERKEQLRCRAGRYAYALGIIVCAVTIMVCGILQALVDGYNFRVLIIYLGLYMVFQYIAGIVIYRRLCKKY